MNEYLNVYEFLDEIPGRIFEDTAGVISKRFLAKMSAGICGKLSKDILEKISKEIIEESLQYSK